MSFGASEHGAAWAVAKLGSLGLSRRINRIASLEISHRPPSDFKRRPLRPLAV